MFPKKIGLSIILIADKRVCTLGEGPFWHPERKQLFWFDILQKKMLSRVRNTKLEWTFDECTSAAGWIDYDTLILASENALSAFSISSGKTHTLTGLETDKPFTRSNDGRADPAGGFWIGTMGKAAEPNAGSIYRFYRGKLELVHTDITISNSICFSPNGRTAYFTDTAIGIIWQQKLDTHGWPTRPPQPFIDLSSTGLKPDGAVVDQKGCLWSAQWGNARVARYSPSGAFLGAISCPSNQVSCPAIGGKAMTTLYVTSAKIGAARDDIMAGQTFMTKLTVQGQEEHRVTF